MVESIGTALLVVIALIWIHRHNAAARRIVRTWAEQNGYEVVRFLWTAHLLGPFPQTWATKQVTRRVLVRDTAGAQRVAWLRFGDAVIGLVDDRVHEVFWERSVG